MSRWQRQFDESGLGNGRNQLPCLKVTLRISSAAALRMTSTRSGLQAMEGVTLGMNYGLRRLAELGVKPTQIRATGGGAQSKTWRQIMADAFNAEVVTLKVSEGAAYGAALQALWCWRLQKGDRVNIGDITDEFVTLNQAETATPKKDAVAAYRELQGLQDALSKSLRGVFVKHRRLGLNRR